MSVLSLFGPGRMGDLTSYFSMDYLMFFLPAVILVYSILGARQKKYFLLIAGYLFFVLISGGLVVYLLFSTFVMFFMGKWLEQLHREEKDVLGTVEKEKKKAVKTQYLKRRRYVMGLGAAFHIGLLLVLKYSGFFMENINSILVLVKIPVQFEIPHFVMPIGISFFTMQAVSYLFDVYRGTIKAERNLFKLALFISFFPQIVEGPICRYEQTAEQLWNVKGIEYKNLAFGLQRILFGMMKKIVIADR